MRPAAPLRRHLGVSAGILVALTALTGCGAIEDLIPVTTPSEVGTTGITLGRAPDVFALSVGECVDAVNGDLHAGVSPVPCAGSHDWEVYVQAGVPGTGASGEDYPGDEVLLATAEATCGAQFAPFLGLDPHSAADSAAATDAVSELGYTYLTPSEADWIAQAEPGVICLIGSMSGPVAGSLAGAAG